MSAVLAYVRNSWKSILIVLGFLCLAIALIIGSRYLLRSTLSSSVPAEPTSTSTIINVSDQMKDIARETSKTVNTEPTSTYSTDMTASEKKLAALFYNLGDMPQ